MQDGKAKQRINWGQAFAEVILIFVAVGIALLADRWTDSQNELEEERQYLVSLQADFEETRENLTGTLENIRRNRDTKLKFLELLQGPQEAISDIELSELVREAFYMQVPIAATATYEDMVNSGDLRLLRDARLKLRLAKFDGAWKDYLNIISEGFDQWNQLQVPFLVRKTRVASVYSAGYEGLQFPGRDEPVDRETIWSQEFKNILAISVISRQDMITVGELVLERVDEVSESIQESLQ